MTNPFFLLALAKYENGRKRHKCELKTIIDECNDSNKQSVNNSDISIRERQGMIEAYNRIADAVLHYVEQSLRKRGRLKECNYMYRKLLQIQKTKV